MRECPSRLILFAIDGPVRVGAGACRRLLVGAWVIDWVMVSLVGTMLPFWVQYVLCPMGSKCADKHSVWVGVLFLALLTSQLLSMPMWLYLTRKLGKRNTWVLYNLVNACTTVLYVFCGEDQVLLATLCMAGLA